MTEQPASYSDVATALETTPIEAMGWLQIFGLVVDQTSVPWAVVKVAATKLGLVVAHAAPSSDAPSKTALAAPEDVSAAIHADTNPRRRFLRTLLHRMDRRGYWHPSCTRTSSLRRGFGEPEAGWVRSSLDALERAGWIKEAAEARKDRTDPPVGLVGEHRADVLRFVLTGGASDRVIADYVKG
jgi:hypothetical protein